MVCVGETGLVMGPSAAAAPPPRSRLTDPIPKPPSTNEPRVETSGPAFLRLHAVVLVNATAYDFVPERPTELSTAARLYAFQFVQGV